MVRVPAKAVRPRHILRAVVKAVMVSIMGGVEDEGRMALQQC